MSDPTTPAACEPSMSSLAIHSKPSATASYPEPQHSSVAPTTTSFTIEASDAVDTVPEIEMPSTLFPKISGKLVELHWNITALLNPNVAASEVQSFIDDASQSTATSHDTTFPFTGTVKLHGTHADILVHPNGAVICQSRNRPNLTVLKDNLGFALFCSTRRAAVRALSKSIQQRYQTLHPSAANNNGTVMLAGEWIGAGVQKGVAISKLTQKRFVLCGIQIAGSWEPIEAYADLEDAAEGLLNISRGGFYHLAYSYADAGQAFFAQAKELTLAVAGACPFGKALGVEGEGEGIVWTPCARSRLPNVPEFWLKTKAEHFAAGCGVRGRAEKVLEVADAGARGKAFAEAQCTESRLEQGWAYLLEMGCERSMKGMGVFLGWLMKDIEVEEKREVEVLGKAWKGETTRIAKPWYERRMKEEAVEGG